MNATSIQAPGAAAPASTRRSRAKAIFAITLGNGLEFFDFTVYSFFASIIGSLYFPVQGSLNQLMLAVGSFGVGFVVRPLGGVVIGAFADRVGRKAAMMLTLWLMALGSALIAFAPTYKQIGLAAPALILLARLVQGFAVGGEVGASTSMLLEYADDRSRGFYGSWQFVSQGLNAVCGALLGVALSTTLSPAALESWGWRVPFVIGLLVVPVGVYIRRHLDETLAHPVPVESTEPVADMARPLREIFARHRVALVAGIVTTIGGTAANYIVLFYMSTYAIKILGLPMSVGMSAALVAALVTAVCSPFAGMLSDRVGRKWVMGVSRVVLIVVIYPAFMVIHAAPTVATVLAVVAVLGAIVAFTAVPNIVMLPELFPQSIRVTGMSVVYCVGVSIFGGFAQFFATWLIKLLDNPLAPAWYLIGCGAVSLLALPLIREPAGRPLD
ncbi:MAG TPA: MFS transporter [Paraburkholderia sp.]|uniref:MFS transporter n=1 Tax=Paraburkholderia sp. TaxID=1926495 RepID=UPI002B98990C|nr:MFS transporter [Paraburkholderia sp.]HTR05471.1 MFS transporter [Paraburkholderia sp.]